MDFTKFSQSSTVITDDLVTYSASIQSSENWCTCGQCTDCSGKEAVCCQSKDELTYLIGSVQCITSTDLFAGLISEGLEYSRFIHASAIRNYQKRQEYLARELTNGLRRHLLYRNFTLVMNSGHPLGRHNRVVLPRCVVEKIRETYPERNADNYTGFIEPISEQEA